MQIIKNLITKKVFQNLFFVFFLISSIKYLISLFYFKIKFRKWNRLDEKKNIIKNKIKLYMDKSNNYNDCNSDEKYFIIINTSKYLANKKLDNDSIKKYTNLFYKFIKKIKIVSMMKK